MRRLPDRLLRDAGIVLGVLWVLGTLAGLALYGRAPLDLVDGNVGGNAVLGLSAGVLAPVLSYARPGNPLGWWMHGLAAANALEVLTGGWATHALVDRPGSLPLGVAAGWVASWVWVVGFLPSFSVLFEVYPSGRVTSATGRVLVRVALGATAVLVTGMASSDHAYSDIVPGSHNPLTGGRLQPLSDFLVGAGLAVALATVLVVVGHILLRLRAAGSPERQQLAWLLATSLPVLLAAFLAPPALTLALTMLYPVGIVVGVLRYRLLDIELVLRRTLVYGGLTAVVVAVYASVVAVLTALVPRSVFPAVIAAAIVAIGVRPAYDVLQQAVSRLVYGDRHDPVRAISRLGRRLSDQAGQTELLPSLARSVAEALRVPYVEAEAQGRVVAQWGDPSLRVRHEVPLMFAGADVGTLRVSGRGPGDRLSGADLTVLGVLAAPVAVAVHAIGLADQLRTAKERVVAATDRERQRLRRDLHDGLGPSLSGVALGLEAAQLATDDPDALRELLRRLREETQNSVLEVRRLVDDLRPAALDGVDLLTAVRQHAAAVASRTGAALTVVVAAPDLVPALPPAVETAAYRIAMEAMTNVVRHAGATRCTVAVRVADALELEVRDDGCGIADRRPNSGVGMDSMRARAAAVGGICTVSPVQPTGTCVLARLPLQVPA